MDEFDIKYGGIIFQWQDSTWKISGYSCLICNNVFISQSRLQKHHISKCLINTVSEN